MAKPSNGFRKGTRRRLSGSLRYKFKPGNFIKEFDVHDIVVIAPDPSSQKGMPFPRFKGLMGEIVEKKNGSYIVRVRSGNRLAVINSNPEHLRLAKTKGESESNL